MLIQPSETDFKCLLSHYGQWWSVGYWLTGSFMFVLITNYDEHQFQIKIILHSTWHKWSTKHTVKWKLLHYATHSASQQTDKLHKYEGNTFWQMIIKRRSSYSLLEDLKCWLALLNCHITHKMHTGKQEEDITVLSSI